MSAHGWRRPWWRLATAVIVSGVVTLAPAAAQVQAPTGLESVVAPIYRRLAALKGLAQPGPPPPAVMRSRAETRRFIEQELARRYSATHLEAERKSMVAWGLIPPDYDLRRLFLDLVEEQISAYYDPRAKTMVLGDWLPPAEQQAALLHELVHALQDREVPLDSFVAPAPGRGDQVLARQALIEGEAVGIMLDVLLRGMGSDLASLPDIAALRGQIAAGSIGPVIQRAPRFLRDLLLFPYVEGLAFIHQWRKRHPWSAMGDLYRDPPRSTAQILHPDRRLTTREDPLPIVLPELDALLPGLRQVTDDEMGEFGLGGVLQLHLPEAEARRTATGWRGDRFRLWEDAQGRFAIAYVVAMDGEPAANRLALALTGVVESRHRALAGKGAPSGGAIVTWREGGWGFALERRGTEVLLIEAVPVGALDRIRDAVWRARGKAGAP
jgi:hypothetical protein